MRSKPMLTNDIFTLETLRVSDCFTRSNHDERMRDRPLCYNMLGIAARHTGSALSTVAREDKGRSIERVGRVIHFARASYFSPQKAAGDRPHKATGQKDEPGQWRKPCVAGSIHSHGN